MISGLRALCTASLLAAATAAASTVSYDSDGLIEISTLVQLNAMRWDLDGDGAADNGTNASAYTTASPSGRGDGLPGRRP